MTPTRIAGVIPARFASTRFPGKILHPIGGRPLIQWVVERAREATAITEWVVATDDERIVAAVEAIGAKAVMTDPDLPSGTDRVAAAIDLSAFDAVVNVQGDEPLMEAALIDRMAKSLSSTNAQGQPLWDMVTAGVKITNAADAAEPAIVKLVTGENGRALYFSRATIPHDRDDGVEAALAKGLLVRHLGVYGYQTAFLKRLVEHPPTPLEESEKLEQLRALHIGGSIQVLEAHTPGPGVDRPEDVALVETALRAEGRL